eukprot:3108525-Rhodomonas_salina.1
MSTLPRLCADVRPRRQSAQAPGSSQAHGGGNQRHHPTFLLIPPCTRMPCGQLKAGEEEEGTRQAEPCTTCHRRPQACSTPGSSTSPRQYQRPGGTAVTVLLVPRN